MKFAGTTVAVAFVAIALSSACGRSAIYYDDAFTEGGAPTDGGPSVVAQKCGDGKCDSNESCDNCSADCGICAGCGDHQCTAKETCSGCPQDCGVCETCGDGFCNGAETCSTCGPDCGKCRACGDGTCDANNEDCFTCPDDCGACKDCGDGFCNASTETCASCDQDCGVCAFCGNNKCEGPYETCTNCHDDCGDCDVKSCLGMLTCAIGCIPGGIGGGLGGGGGGGGGGGSSSGSSGSGIPVISISCLGQCVAEGCPQAQSVFDDAFNCIIQHFQDVQSCGGFSLPCIQKICPSVSACLGLQCPNQ